MPTRAHTHTHTHTHILKSLLEKPHLMSSKVGLSTKDKIPRMNHGARFLQRWWEARGVWKIETEGRSMVVTEEAKFALGRMQCHRNWESEAEDSTGSERNGVAYNIRSGRLKLLGKLKQSKMFKAKWTFLRYIQRKDGILLEKMMSR